ncbi:MAG: HNH endonuclease, partial [Rhodobacteraceae bacterium]|nr:HNH endonuclease [Paracoccaceae bacterium]
MCIIQKSAHGKPAGAFALGGSRGEGDAVPRKPCAHPGCFLLVELGTVYCEAHSVSDKRDRDRPADAKRADRPSRKWYKRKAWSGKGGRREVQLDAEPLCRLCPDHSKRPATVADHVIPHREDHGLFWFGELQSLCKACHDSKKQRLEHRALGGGQKSTTPWPGT